MKHLLILFLLLTAGSICYATSNITFSGGGYEISVLLSDEDCKVVGLNVSRDNPTSRRFAKFAVLPRKQGDFQA
jgi:hypothetical protein